ncbi:MAG: hypothetical protein Q8R28_02205 [Dehalococcoidia bacterium]|nr:hypothetical protein [Dehalococcoidia bacterium]
MLQRNEAPNQAVGPVRQVSEDVTLHDHDLLPPILRLSQSQSSKGEPGKFYRTDTDDIVDPVDVVPLTVRAGRTKWPDGEFNRESRPECWSVDGLHPAKNTVGEGQGIVNCSACPFYTAVPWEASRSRGDCIADYRVVLMDISDYQLYLMQLSGTAAKMARLLGNQGIIKRAVVHLSAAKVESKSGIYFQMSGKTVRRLDEAELDLVAANAQAFRGVALDTERQDDGEVQAGEQAAPPQAPAPAPAAQTPDASRTRPVQRPQTTVVNPPPLPSRPTPPDPKEVEDMFAGSEVVKAANARTGVQVPIVSQVSILDDDDLPF